MRSVGNLRAELLIGFLLKGAGAASSFGLTWLIARGFGAATVGFFQIALATANLASIFAAQGLDRVTVRLVSGSLVNGRLGEAAAYFRSAFVRQLLLGGIIGLIVFWCAEDFARDVLGEPKAANFLRVLAPTIIGLTLIRLCASLLRSKGRILLSQSLDGVTYTTLAACLVGVAALAGRTAWPLLPAIAYLLCTTLVLIYAIWRVHKMTRHWGSSAVTLSVSAGLYIAAFQGLANVSDWFGLMLLTRGEGASAAGIYRTAFQVCLLFTIVNSSFAVIVGPRIAAAAEVRDLAAIRKANRTASILGTLICLPLFVIVVWQAEAVLGLFGQPFVVGADALRILAAGQLINVAFGPMGASLTMMSREKFVFMIELLATACAVAIIAIGVPAYGMLAVAVGSAVASISRNALSWFALRWQMRQLQLAPTSV